MNFKAPKFNKVELLLTQNNELSVIKEEFNNCGLMITGDYIIITTDETTDINHSLITTGKVFNIKNVISYRTHSI
jgi:hypothetical protein